MTLTPPAAQANPPGSILSLIPVPALDNTFGAILLGTFGGLILYGITLHQSYRYFHTCPGDGKVLKGLVAAVVILETVTSVFVMHASYYYLVSKYFDPIALLYGSWSIKILPLASGVVMCTTQSFFVRRVFLLGHGYRVVVAVAVLFCLLELGFYTAATVEAVKIPTYEGFQRYTWLVSTGFTMAVSADTLLTAVLILVLRRSRTGIQRTDSTLEVMIIYSINTGLLTGVSNLLSLLFAFISPQNMIYIGLGVPGAKLYANTLLAALNSRQSLATKFSGTVHMSPFGYNTHVDPNPSASDSHRILSAPRTAVSQQVSHDTTSSELMVIHITKDTATMSEGSTARDVSVG